MVRSPLTILVASLAAIALVGCSGNENADSKDGGLPNQLVWTTHGTGTSTYADLAAVADSITKAEGTNIRIITSDTSVGRLTPLKEGQAQMTRLGDEYIYAFEGDYEFAGPEWGPQDVRVAWAPTAAAGLLVKESSGIESVSDLKGKRVPSITLNPSTNNKISAALEAAGITPDDVEFVKMGYGEQAEALQNGKIDVLYSSVFAGNLFELDGITPVDWLDLGADDVDPESIADAVPSATIDDISGGPGQEDDDKIQTYWYPIPVVAMADLDEETVYETVKAMNATYEDYKDATQTTANWNTDNAQLEPTEVPFHPGTIKYLKEEGLWTEEAADRNDELVKRGKTLRSGWHDFLNSAGDDVPSEWAAWKEQNASQE